MGLRSGKSNNRKLNRADAGRSANRRVDFYDLESRIKLEDLKLNVIHHIESLRDETTYRDNLTNSVFFD